MLIYRDTTGITVKRTIDTADHVRVGILGEVRLWKRETSRHLVTYPKKPHDSYTVGELGDLLAQLERLP